MSTQSARKRKSNEMDNEPTTPTGSPVKKMKISQTQKQALIDVLQLEITERARSLRAQYALQCSDLRSRIERRINRVPIGLRSMKMGELMQHQQDSQGASNPPPTQSIPRSPSKQQHEERPLPALPSSSKLPSPAKQPILQSQKSRKRKSSAILIPSDKENEPDTSTTAPESLPVQKNAKRAKTAAPAAHSAQKRAPSRTQKKPLTANGNHSGVLSPRSHNSRTLPKSPVKDKDLPVPGRETSPLRQQQSPQRPASPSKPVSPFKAATSAISAFAKRGYAAAGAAGARLTRPLSREKDQTILSGMGTTIPASPAAKMLPPPRPALATLTSTSAPTIPTLSPQRTASQASMRSTTSERSNASTNATVVTKPARTLTTKKQATISKATGRKVAATTASKTKAKVIVSGSTVSATSPKAASTGLKRSATTVTAAVKKSTTTKKTNVTEIAATGRVLRKRN